MIHEICTGRGEGVRDNMPYAHVHLCPLAPRAFLTGPKLHYEIWEYC